MRQMLEAGIHFGHQTRFWNPKMAPFIFGHSNKIHIINLEKTLAKFNEAMDAYNRVITSFPKGDKVPDAYYKRGLAMERMGQIDGAQESWNAAVKSFPDSDAGRLAKQSLDRVARRTTP